MALGGTLLPSISTFASGPAVKSKPIGVANSVSSMRPLSHEVLLCERGAAHWDIFVSATVSLCSAAIGLGTTLCRGVHQFTQADPVSSQQSVESGGSTHGTVQTKHPRLSIITSIVFVSFYRNGSFIGDKLTAAVLVAE